MDDIEQLIERAKKERKDRDGAAWAACAQLTIGENLEFATELALKAQGYHDEFQDTLRSIGLRVYLTDGGES